MGNTNTWGRIAIESNGDDVSSANPIPIAIGSGDASMTNAISRVTGNFSSVTTLTAWERAQIEGNTYQASYFDTTGITNGVSYYYFARNTSTTKTVRVRPPQFNPGTFLFQIVNPSALLKLGGVVTPPTESSAIALPTWNNGGSNASALQIYFESGLGAWTWDEAVTVQAAKRYISILGQPLSFESYAAQIAPGGGFWVIFTNYGTVKLPYGFNIEWSELNV